MRDSNIFRLNTLEQNDPLQAVLREGARKILVVAIESEVVSFIGRHGNLNTDEDKSAVLRNGYFPIGRFNPDYEILKPKYQKYRIVREQSCHNGSRVT